MRKAIKLFLRLAIAAGFLSAVADRFGLWPAQASAWGNWNNFVEYTATITPFIPNSAAQVLAIIATAAEVLFAICLIVGFKTKLFANLSGLLLLTFALCMTFSIGIKPVFDYSVFAAAAGAFALGTMKEKFLEVSK